MNSTQVNIQTWRQSNGHSYAKVKLTFPNAGYRVQDQNWGIPPSGVLPLVGNQLTADALVEIFNGASIQQLVTTVQIYDLGTLADGGYTFNFKTSGQTALAVNFTVTSAPPANPIDNQREFVRWQYKDFLGREPDHCGLGLLDRQHHEMSGCCSSSSGTINRSVSGQAKRNYLWRILPLARVPVHGLLRLPCLQGSFRQSAILV